MYVCYKVNFAWCNDSVASARILSEYLEMHFGVYPGHPSLWGGSSLCLLVPSCSDQADCLQVSTDRCQICVTEGGLFYCVGIG